MDKKKLSLATLITTALVVLFGLLKNVLPQVHIFTAFDTLLGPLLFTAALICGYFLFKDAVTRPGKCIWIVIAMLFALALENFQEISYNLFVLKAPVLQVLAPVVYTAGFVCILLSLLDGKFDKLLTIGLGVLTLGAVLPMQFTAAAVVEFLFYVLLALAAQDFTPALCRLFRILAVVAAVVSLSSLGVLAAIGWLVFAFILVPAQKPRFSLAKFTAVLCVITAVLVLVAFVASKPTASIDSINYQITSAKQSITYCDERIVSLQADIVEYNTTLDTANAALEKENSALTEANAALEKAQTDLQVANTNLDAVCYRSYYSYWGCTETCRPFHSAVSSCQSIVSEKEDAAEQCQYNILQLENTIETANNNILQAQADIVSNEEEIVRLTEQLSNLRSQLIEAWFMVLFCVLALLLTLAALVIMAICLFKATYGKQALLACGVMALSSLLSLVAGSATSLGSAPVWLYLLTSVHTWNIVLCTLFAAVFAEKTNKRTTVRVLSVIVAAIVGALCATSGAGIVYAVTMILLAFVLVPVVFTEYIGIGKHILLSLITCGLWQLIWVYNVTKNLNKVAGVASRRPCRTLLLYMFLPFYSAYWTLKTAENVEAYAAANSKQYKLDIVSLVFAFICPLFSTVLIQNKINMIVGKPK